MEAKLTEEEFHQACAIINSIGKNAPTQPIARAMRVNLRAAKICFSKPFELALAITTGLVFYFCSINTASAEDANFSFTAPGKIGRAHV